MTVQNVTGSVAITNVQPPPEGPMAALIEFILNSATPSISQSLQLNSQGGLLLSQVVSLSINNSENAFPILITHGALSEVVQIGAGATVIIPTFSNRGPYQITVATLGGVAPAVDLPVEVVFLNYPRQSGTFSATQQSTIAATGQNTSSLFSNTFSVTANGNQTVLSVGNYVIDSLDIAIDGLEATTATLATATIKLIAGGTVTFSTQAYIVTASGASQFLSGANNGPIQRTWPQGLILPRGGNVVLNATITNTSLAIVRVNLSGLNLP